MSDFGLAVGDTYPVLDLTLTDNGLPIAAIPSGSVATLLVRDAAGTLIINTPTVIDTDQTNHPGHVIYPWQSADTAAAGDCTAHVLLTRPDGSRQTFPDGDAITITIDPPFIARYATVRALRDRLAPTSSQRDGQSAALLAASQLDECLLRAQSEIDARLTGRYFVPFDGQPPGASSPQTVPAVIRDICLDLAAWHATLDYRRADTVSPDDPARLRANAAETLLGQLVAGQAILPGAALATAVVATDVTDPVVVNQAWHTSDLTDDRQLRPVPAIDWPPRW